MIKNKYLRLTLVAIFSSILIFISTTLSKINQEVPTGAPPYVVEDLLSPEDEGLHILKNWKRPNVKAKVGLQVGHWRSNELPEELSRLRNNTGATGGGKAEWEVNLQIAQSTAAILKDKDIDVDILPATIPEKYWADVFVAIHADGSLSPTPSGFKLASPRRDFSGSAIELLKAIEVEYQKSTKLPLDPNVSRNMRGYYAFAWWRYKNAVHPMTSSVILETGFLTNPQDRKVIVDNPTLSSSGLASGIIKYLGSKGLLEDKNR